MMTMKERDELRALQDRFLALAWVRRAAEAGGADEPLWRAGPTLAEVVQQLHPDYRHVFERCLEEADLYR